MSIFCHFFLLCVLWLYTFTLYIDALPVSATYFTGISGGNLTEFAMNVPDAHDETSLIVRILIMRYGLSILFQLILYPTNRRISFTCPQDIFLGHPLHPSHPLAVTSSLYSSLGVVSIQIACEEIPSPVPVKPRPSSVVALTLTCSTSI